MREQGETFQCELASGTPDVPDYSPVYTFSICDLSLGDADSSGTVDFGDVASVLANYQISTCLQDGDPDRDGDVEFADVAVILANYGSVYCQSGGQSLSGTPESGNGMTTDGAFFDADTSGGAASQSVATVIDALQHMGYAGIDQFVEALSQMDEPTRLGELARLGELLGE